MHQKLVKQNKREIIKSKNSKTTMMKLIEKRKKITNKY